jgi:electron transfer flavoprotein beta subunit
MDPIDEVTVSAAIKIREKAGGEVTAITLGPSRSEEVLRSCLKMGVDKAIHVFDEAFDNLDAYSTSALLSSQIAKLQYDLVLCGNRSMDECNGFVGAGIAEALHLPLVTDVTRIDIFADTNTAVVHRRLKGGDREVVETALPAVFTGETVLTSPIYPRLRTILDGLKKDIIRVDTPSLSKDVVSIEPLLSLLSISQPKPRLKKTATIDSSLTPHERMKLIISGGVQQKSSKAVAKPPDEAASEIVKFLIENGIISKEK